MELHCGSTEVHARHRDQASNVLTPAWCPGTTPEDAAAAWTLAWTRDELNRRTDVLVTTAHEVQRHERCRFTVRESGDLLVEPYGQDAILAVYARGQWISAELVVPAEVG